MDKTEIVVVLDKSGSMEGVKSDTIGGYNEFVKSQQELDGEANLTLVLFDTVYHLGEPTPIANVEPMTSDSFRPSGMTALLDATGRAISETGKRLEEMPESTRPDKVIVVIITDGQENSSREVTKEQLKQAIEHQQAVYNWKFLFLSSDLEAIQDANCFHNTVLDYGISPMLSATGTNCKKMFGSVSSAVTSYRNTGEISSSWKA